MTDNAVTKRVKWSDMQSLPNNPINKTRIERIEGNGGFHPAHVGTPELCLNDAKAFLDLPEDAVVLADGHHRREMAIRKGLGAEAVICKVHRGMTRERVEALFLDLNNYRTHQPNELFVHRVASEEAKALAMNKILESVGFWVPVHNKAVIDGIRSITAVEWVYDGAGHGNGVHPVVLRRTLEGLREMYGGEDKNALKGNMVKGLGLFHLRYDKMVDLERLHEMVPASFPVARRVLQAADELRNAMNYLVPESVARVIRGAYNGKRRSKASLPEWSA